MFTREQRKESLAFCQWLRTRPIDAHLAKTMTPTEIEQLKARARLHTPSYNRRFLTS